ncbi:MAG: tripartite tricarboxylate transporter substrate binding protein [Betaproteobacteria bacterium]|nr:tripartite tricarboxylate transporter substrate binding protein [Betaproteobacteria bacterium]
MIRKMISVGLSLLAMACAGPLAAQNYPNKSVRIVVPFAPGGSADGTARPVAERLSSLLGQPFVIDNRPGGYGTVGAGQVAKSDPDGYTLLLVPGTHVLTPRLLPNLGYHAINDFSPIATLVFAPYVIIGAKNLPFSNLKDAMHYAREQPGKLSIGNSEVTTRLAGESLAKAAGVAVTHVPYKGGGPIANDVLGGHLAIGVVTPISALGFHREKRVNSLAVTSPKRLSSLPDVPTVAEALGIAEYDSQTWFALAGPANMPRAVVDRLSLAIRQIMQDRDMLERFTNMGLVPAEDTSPDRLARLMKSFSERNGVLIDAAKLKLD